APHGHQGLDSTTLPVNLAIGATFNKKLYEKNQSNVAKEIRFKGAHLALLSCLDLALDPRWGRSEECFGEDTYLSMQMTKHAIRGLQGRGDKISFDKVAVIAKHLIGQGSAFGGHNGKSVSMGWNELKAHHIPIAIEATKQKVAGFMVAYNDIDKVPCHTNKKLLDYIKAQNEFKGIFMSDGCGIDNILNYTKEPINAISQAINAGVGVDLWNETFNSFEMALNQGKINRDFFDDAIERTEYLRKRLDILKYP
ncbi:glycoside hydrolase family 3 N-terminal domain-containing protein, partial [Mycoplasma marinum]